MLLTNIILYAFLSAYLSIKVYISKYFFSQLHVLKFLAENILIYFLLEIVSNVRGLKNWHSSLDPVWRKQFDLGKTNKKETNK